MRSISRRKFIAGGLGIISTAIAADALWYEKFFIEITEHFIGDATPDTGNISLVQISDLHLRSLDDRHRQLVSEMNRLKPDMLLFTGDVIDRNRNLEKLDEFLSLFDPGIQKVAILGNWECWKVHPHDLLKVYDKHQCELIVNHSYRYIFGNTSVSISGMDDLVGGRADFPMAMESYRNADYHIVLTHCPEHRDIIQQQSADIPIDLILSGHTHGGQIQLFGFAPFRPKGSGRYVNGWSRESVPHMYVSRGIGTSALPVRFGSRAEVSIFYLRT